MSPENVLFALRLIGAIALLLFMALIAWLIYKDIQAVTELGGQREERFGMLQVIGDEASPIPAGSSFSLLPVTSIGRALSNTIVIDDDFVSNRHVLFSLRGKNWWAEDLESRNGTALNGHPLESPTVISEGDIITIGHTRIRIKI